MANFFLFAPNHYNKHKNHWNMYMSKMFVLSKLLPPSVELQNIFCCCWFVLKLFLVCTLFKIAVVSFGFVPYLAH